MTTISRTVPHEHLGPARRRFLARLGIGAAALGALAGGALPAAAQAAAPAPRRHAIDDWMDALPTAHRIFFDGISPDGVGDIRAYASNYFVANKSGYDLDNSEIGVLIILRHTATPFAYNDAMWAKYGSVFASDLKLPRTPDTNPGIAGDESLDSLSAKGAHFGVCGMATRRYAGMLARNGGATSDAVFEELGKNLIRNAHITPAGIVAVGRAQERGFAFGYAR